MAYIIRRYGDLIAAPWRNGGGVTREIAAWPPDADMSTFDWRISLATVEGSGPFSPFPAIDRILTVVDGALDLSLLDAPPRRLVGTSAPFAFPGEAAVWAEAPEGPATDFNVMSRRDRIAAEVTRVRGPMIVDLAGAGWILILATRAGSLTLDGRCEHLEPFDALLADAHLAEAKIAFAQHSRMILARLDVV